MAVSNIEAVIFCLEGVIPGEAKVSQVASKLQAMSEGSETNKGYGDWLTKCVETFRAACLDVAAEDRANLIPRLCTLFEPCQLYLLGFANPPFHILLVTHLKTVPDLTQIIQVDIPGAQLVEFMEGFIGREEFRSGPKWEQSLVEYATSLAGRLEDYFVRLLERGIRTFLATPPEGLSGRNFGDGAWLWEYRGNILNTSAEAFRQQLVNGVRNALKPPSLPAQPAQLPSPVRAYGAYFYPPVQIGEVPKPSFRERIGGIAWSMRADAPVVKANYKGASIMAAADGLVSVTTADRHRALRSLNEIMGAFQISGIHTFAVRGQSWWN
jgi:hypothetical protein